MFVINDTYPLLYTFDKFVSTFKSQQAGAVVMYNCSNGTTTGQVFDFIHHWEDGLLFGLSFIFPVAQLQKHTWERANNAIKHCSTDPLRDVVNVSM